MNIILIGPRGSGKTTTGRSLSLRMNKTFIDTDELIEKYEGISIEKMVELYGWPYFRILEKKIISEVSNLNDSIISVGGGAVLDSCNRGILKKNGFIIYLNAKPEILIKRMMKDTKPIKSRPSLTGKETIEEVREILTKREHIYKNFSDFQIDTSYLGVSEVVEHIISKLNKRGI